MTNDLILFYEYLDEYSPIPYTEFVCQHCGCTEQVLGERVPKHQYCTCCGEEHKRLIAGKTRQAVADD